MPELTPGEEATEIEETNARFYRAVESRDLDAMEALWLHADYVRCVHPGWCLLSGWDAVRQSRLPHPHGRARGRGAIGRG